VRDARKSTRFLQVIILLLGMLLLGAAVAGCGGSSGTTTTAAPSGATTTSGVETPTTAPTATTRQATETTVPATSTTVGQSSTTASTGGGALSYGANSLAYAAPVTADQAQKLLDYLASTFSWDKTSPTGMSFAIAMNGNVYALAMVIKKGTETDKTILASAKSLAQDASKKVFAGAEVDVYLTDATWSPLAVVKP